MVVVVSFRYLGLVFVIYYDLLVVGLNVMLFDSKLFCCC